MTMPEAIEQMTPGERWENMPRPLKYVRPRLYPDGARYLRNLLEMEQSDEEDHLASLRAGGLTEGDPKIVEVRTNLSHLAQLIRDVSLGLIELVGPPPKED